MAYDKFWTCSINLKNIGENVTRGVRSKVASKDWDGHYALLALRAMVGSRDKASGRASGGSPGAAAPESLGF